MRRADERVPKSRCEENFSGLVLSPCRRRPTRPNTNTNSQYQCQRNIFEHYTPNKKPVFNKNRPFATIRNQGWRNKVMRLNRKYRHPLYPESNSLKSGRLRKIIA